jgi:hypothetical protein
MANVMLSIDTQDLPQKYVKMMSGYTKYGLDFYINFSIYQTKSGAMRVNVINGFLNS